VLIEKYTEYNQIKDLGVSFISRDCYSTI